MRHIGFALCGPLIPLLPLCAVIVLAGSDEHNMVYGVLIFGFLIGLIPSIIAAITFRYLKHSSWSGIKQRPNFVIGALSGAVPGSIGALWIFLAPDGSTPAMALPFLLTCLVAGGVCGQLFGLRSITTDPN